MPYLLCHYSQCPACYATPHYACLRCYYSLCYSVLVQVVKAKTAQGFVPNGYAPTRKSTHSQPPVGSKVLLEMYRKYFLTNLLTD